MPLLLATSLCLAHSPLLPCLSICRASLLSALPSLPPIILSSLLLSSLVILSTTAPSPPPLPPLTSFVPLLLSPLTLAQLPKSKSPPLPSICICPSLHVLTASQQTFGGLEDERPNGFISGQAQCRRKSHSVFKLNEHAFVGAGLRARKKALCHVTEVTDDLNSPPPQSQMFSLSYYDT